MQLCQHKRNSICVGCHKLTWWICKGPWCSSLERSNVTWMSVQGYQMSVGANGYLHPETNMKDYCLVSVNHRGLDCTSVVRGNVHHCLIQVWRRVVAARSGQPRDKCSGGPDNCVNSVSCLYELLNPKAHFHVLETREMKRARPKQCWLFVVIHLGTITFLVPAIIWLMFLDSQIHW